MSASNTKDLIREFFGLRVVGMFFDTFPLDRRNLSPGTKTLVFEDGRGLTFAANGSFWSESSSDVERAVKRAQDLIAENMRDLEEVLALAGGGPREGTSG